jgi:hypothetical protein
VFNSRCLVTDSNSVDFSASVFHGSDPRWQASISLEHTYSDCRFSTCSKSRLISDRRSVGQSVFVSGTHLGPAANFFLHSLIIFRQLRVCRCGAPSLTRGMVCVFQLLLGIASVAFPGSESRGTHEHIFLSHPLRLSEPGGSSSCIYFPQEQGSPVISPGTGYYPGDKASGRTQHETQHPLRGPAENALSRVVYPADCSNDSLLPSQLLS